MKSFAVAKNEKAKKPLHLMQGFLQLTTYEIFITPQAFYCKAVSLISYEFL